MNSYEWQQKREFAQEAWISYFSRGLSWFLHLIVNLLTSFIKAGIEAAKLLFHI